MQLFDIRTSKSAPGLQFFNVFTSECAFRHSGVQFFDIRTSKSAPKTTYSFSTFSLPNVLFATAACNFSTSELQKVLWHRQFFLTFSLPNVLFATAACNFSTSELQKVLRRLQFFNIFTSKCAFRHSGMQFFDIRTSKSAPTPSVFQHFHIQMCFSPQRRAIFRHQNFKKCSDTVFLSIFTSKCAFHHSGVQFLMSPLSTYLRTRRFNRPTFRLTRHTNHWKNTAFRDFSNIWRGCIFFLLTFALLHLLSADLTTLLCFSTVHIVGSFYLNFLRWLDEDTSRHFVSCVAMQRCSNMTPTKATTETETSEAAELSSSGATSEAGFRRLLFFLNLDLFGFQDPLSCQLSP